MTSKSPINTTLEHKCAVGIEDLKALVEYISHHDPAVGPDGDIMRPDKLPAVAAHRPKSERERAVGVKNVDSLVESSVSHHNPAVGPDCDPLRMEVLATVTLQPKRERKCAIGMEDLDAASGRVRHNDHARIARGGMDDGIRRSGDHRQPGGNDGQRQHSA